MTYSLVEAIVLGAALVAGGVSLYGLGRLAPSGGSGVRRGGGLGHGRPPGLVRGVLAAAVSRHGDPGTRAGRLHAASALGRSVPAVWFGLTPTNF